jgi:hypothetical protein
MYFLNFTPGNKHNGLALYMGNDFDNQSEQTILNYRTRSWNLDVDSTREQIIAEMTRLGKLNFFSFALGGHTTVKAASSEYVAYKVDEEGG